MNRGNPDTDQVFHGFEHCFKSHARTTSLLYEVTDVQAASVRANWTKGEAYTTSVIDVSFHESSI